MAIVHHHPIMDVMTAKTKTMLHKRASMFSVRRFAVFYMKQQEM
jgi:hypothetical protein